MLGIIFGFAMLSLAILFFTVTRDGLEKGSSAGDKVRSFAIITWVVMLVVGVLMAFLNNGNA